MLRPTPNLNELIRKDHPLFVELKHKLGIISVPPKQVRFDAVLWQAYPTTIEHLSEVSVQWFPLLSDPYEVALSVGGVGILDGPVFDYLIPFFDEGVDWYGLRELVMKGLHEAWMSMALN